MPKSQVQWIIKGEDGKVRGPFSTEQVIRMIAHHELSGDESIALYPGRDWKSISREPEFYDRLLEALASAKVDYSRGEDDDILGQTPVAKREEVDEEPTPGPRPPPIHETVPPRGPQKVQSKSKRSAHTPPDIEMEDMQSRIRKEVMKRATKPVLLVALAIVVAAIFLLSDRGEEDRVHLIEPRKNQGSLALDVVKDKTRRAVAAYVRDIFSQYQVAQNELVQVVEGDPKNHDVMALLCLTYLELWPYAFQDSADLQAVRSVTQLASAVDPAGLNSSTCKAVDLMVGGKYDQAKGLIESVIDSQSQKGEPAIALYYLKALVLDAAGDDASAIGYLKSAQRLWPQWIRAYAYEANLQAKVGNFSEAVTLLQNVLNANPKHQVARIELGILEFRQFSHPEKAEALLREAISSGEKIPRRNQSMAFMVLAEIALKRNDRSQALDLAQKAYALDPGNASAKNLVVGLGGVKKLRETNVKVSQLVFEGDQLVQEGDCYAAQAHYKAAFQKEPKNAQAAYKAAECLWKISFTTDAIEWLNKAISADPTYIAAYVLLADFYTQRYNFIWAAKTLATAQRMNPKSYEVFRGLALIELKRGSAATAVGYAKRAADLYQMDVDTHVVMADAYVALRDYRNASSAASRAVEIDGNYPKAHIVYAKALAGLQGVDVAISYLSDRVRIFPVIIDYRLALGEMLSSEERYFEAENIYRETVNLNPKSKAALIGLGRALRMQKKYPEAQEILLGAAVLDPTDPEPLFEAGLVYLEVDKPAEASAQFDRVLKVNPSYPRVNYQKGRAQLQKGDAKEALRLAQEEKNINPNLADAYLLAAEAYAKLGQYSLCAGEYQKAVKLRPQGAAIYVKIAQCYRQSGNLDVASAMLQHAEQQESGYAEIYKEQGQVYEMKGDYVKAIEAYNQYFVLDPSSPDRAEIEGRINKLRSK